MTELILPAWLFVAPLQMAAVIGRCIYKQPRNLFLILLPAELYALALLLAK